MRVRSMPHNPADPPDRLEQALDVALTALDLPRTRVTGLRIPAGTVHHGTDVFAISWDAFDRLWPSDGWEHETRIIDDEHGERLHEVKRLDVLDGRIVAYPPVRGDRPRTMVCPHCRGEGRVVVNAVVFSIRPDLDERDERTLVCGVCEGAGRVARDPDTTDPLGLNGLLPDSEDDIPW